MGKVAQLIEPDYIAQCGDPFPTKKDRMDWIRERVDEAKEKGCDWFRVSVHEDDRDLLLIEGWKKKPKDEGPARFQFEPV